MNGKNDEKQKIDTKNDREKRKKKPPIFASAAQETDRFQHT